MDLLKELPFADVLEDQDLPSSFCKASHYDSGLFTDTTSDSDGSESCENVVLVSIEPLAPSSPAISRNQVPLPPPPPPISGSIRNDVPPPPPPPPISGSIRNDVPPPPPLPPISGSRMNDVPPPPLPTLLPAISTIPTPPSPPPVQFWNNFTRPTRSHQPRSADITPAEEYAECFICYSQTFRPKSLHCCGQLICRECLELTITSKIDEGLIQFTCPSTECDKHFSATQVKEILFNKRDYLKKYDQYRLARSQSDTEKVCPNCSHLTVHTVPKRLFGNKQADVHISCVKCSFEWCFSCHGPWHTNQTCREFKKGDGEFKKWIRKKENRGSANGQKCPSCRTPIQRSSGCDHMTCSECKTHFCYSCGGRHFSLVFLGDHYDGLSPFGCPKYYTGPKNTRKLTKGGYLATKLSYGLSYPSLVAAGIVVVAVGGAVILPIYGGVKLYKNIKHKRRLEAQRKRVAEQSTARVAAARQLQTQSSWDSSTTDDSSDSELNAFTYRSRQRSLGEVGFFSRNSDPDLRARFMVLLNQEQQRREEEFLRQDVMLF